MRVNRRRDPYDLGLILIFVCICFFFRCAPFYLELPCPQKRGSFINPLVTGCDSFSNDYPEQLGAARSLGAV